MPKSSGIRGINRIFDANINRIKEGLRVCEEITRFLICSISLTAGYKRIRHKINTLTGELASSKELFKERQSLTDTGRNIKLSSELKRKNPADIFLANMQRVKESVRVLEEFSKLKDTRVSLGFKRIRYQIYELEKKTSKRLAGLSGNR